ncbi:MAG TPA: PHP domain-containing protein [Verrucomicrobiales bacterium]|nr:PHP domain-containing protein [Verrucomicrobiales bacterium]
MALKFDLHTHSSFSSDGVSAPEDVIAVARSKGLHGIAITDHNTCEATPYLVEKGLVRRDGLPVDGFLVVPGVEVTTCDGHILCLGATLHNMRGRPSLEVCNAIHDAGGLAVAPHPFDRFRAGIRQAVLDTLPLDAIEVFNAATTLDRHNRRALDYAASRRLSMIAGSDAHHCSVVGTAYTMLATDDFTLRGVIRQLPQPGNDIFSQYLGFRAWAKKIIGLLRSVPAPAPAPPKS